MDSRVSSAEKAYENEFSEFLIRRIKTASGSLKLQHITGHLSQVRNEVRNAVVSSQTDLIKFLIKHDNLFAIDNNDVVTLKSSALSSSGYESDASSTKSHSNLPLKIKNGKGVIVKIFPGYGFIKSKEPIKTEIFFNSLCFGDRKIDLTSFLYVGAIVFFYAKRESSNFSCKYHALKVWRVDNDDDEGSVIVQKSRKNRETGLYDPLNLESEGVIQNIFPNLGFISVKGDDKNTVFFHKNRVVNYDNIVDLTKVFSKGDKVEFTAHRSSKPDAKARWEAAKVWKISGKIKENTSQSGDKQLSLPKHSVPILRTKVPEMIKNQRGKIYPRSHGAVVKFGNNEIADGDSAVYYICGSQVTDIGWEFTEGDDVYFDAVKIKSAPGWKAVLVWTDTKPDIVLPTCIGDFSGFTEDDDNAENCNSVYTSKSSLCVSENSNSSLKSENLSKTKDIKREKSHKLSKNDKASSRDSLNSWSHSDKHGFGGKEAKSTNNLSRNYSRDSLNSLSYSDKYSSSKENKGTNKKLSKNYNASSKDSLNSMTTSDKDHPLKNSESSVKSSSSKSNHSNNKMISNWGDSPFPADEAYENMEASKSFKSNIFLKCDNEVKQFTKDDIENSSEYGSDDDDDDNEEEELVNKKSEIDNKKTSSHKNSLKNFEIESSKTSSQSDSLCAASVKKYQDIIGEINKVYSRFAEVKSSHLQYAVSFSLNDFYSNGISMDELDLDDLKDVLNVGDTIHFNCFLIIDDFGQNWQKITLAWKGYKPKYVKEIGSEDFIKENDLSVTVNSKANNDEIESKASHRKFLTSFVDEIPDDTTDNNLSRTESCSEEEESTLVSKSQIYNKPEQSVDSENLSDIICSLLKKNVFSDDSMIDIKSVSEEIINAVLQNYDTKHYTLTCNVLPEAKCTSEPLENVCPKCKERSLNLSNCSVKTKSTAAQTIITGEIISQNILADC